MPGPKLVGDYGAVWEGSSQLAPGLPHRFPTIINRALFVPHVGVKLPGVHSQVSNELSIRAFNGEPSGIFLFMRKITALPAIRFSRMMVVLFATVCIANSTSRRSKISTQVVYNRTEFCLELFWHVLLQWTNDLGREDREQLISEASFDVLSI
jgi:hypothetical protein